MSERYGPFVAPKLKLAWARKHLVELKERIDVFAASNPFNIYINTYRHRTPVLIFGMIRPIPPDVSLVYGDVVHCLRSSLDLMACDAVRLNGQPADKVYFPFAKSAQELDKQIKLKRFNLAGAKAEDLLKQVRPYKGGNDALHALHELDVRDKHQAILPTFPMLAIPDMVIDCGPRSRVGLKDIGLGPDTGIGIGSIPRRVVFNEPVILETVFDSAAPTIFRHKQLLETLESLHDLVAGVIKAFELLPLGTIVEPPLLSPVTQDTPLNDRPKIIVRDLDGSPFLLSDINDTISSMGIVKLNSFRFTNESEEFYEKPITD